MGILELQQSGYQEHQLVHPSASGKCGHSEDHRSRTEEQEEEEEADTIAGYAVFYGFG
jgi:hypothetical protein